MQTSLQAIILAATVLGISVPAFGNDRALLQGSRTYRSGQDRVGAAGAAEMPGQIATWLAEYAGWTELDRWKPENEGKIHTLLKNTGMPGVLIHVRRETSNTDVARVTRLVGGKPVLMGSGLDPASTLKAYADSGNGDLNPRVSDGYHDDLAASEYLWVQEKDGKLFYGERSAEQLNRQVLLDLSDQKLRDAFAARYDIEASARAVEHLSVNAGDESLRAEAAGLLKQRRHALEERARIDRELVEQLQRDMKANAAAATFQTISSVLGLGAAVADMITQFPDKKGDLDKAAATNSAKAVADVLDRVKEESKSSTARLAELKKANEAQMESIRKLQQSVLIKGGIDRYKVPGINAQPSNRPDEANSAGQVPLRHLN